MQPAVVLAAVTAGLAIVVALLKRKLRTVASLRANLRSPAPAIDPFDRHRATLVTARQAVEQAEVFVDRMAAEADDLLAEAERRVRSLPKDVPQPPCAGARGLGCEENSGRDRL